MATEAQLRANRINAQRSTGPRTSEGKEHSRFNALKHGLAAELVVLPYEDVAEYHELRGALLTQYQPQNASETFLVDQVAQNWWRLNRSRRYETGMLSKLNPETGEGPSYQDLDHHRRYEAAIERAYYRAYDRLEKIVRRRPAPQPEEPKEVDPLGFVPQEPSLVATATPPEPPAAPFAAVSEDVSTPGAGKAHTGILKPPL
jgi:hypothetical protein